MCTNKQLVFYTELKTQMGHEPSEEDLSRFSVMGIAQASEVITALIKERDELSLKTNGQSDDGEMR